MDDFLLALDNEIARLEETLAENPQYHQLRELRKVRILYTPPTGPEAAEILARIMEGVAIGKKHVPID